MDNNDIVALTNFVPPRRLTEICGGIKVTNWEHISSLHDYGIRLATGTPLNSLVDAVFDETTGEWDCSVWLSEKRSSDFSLTFLALSVLAELEDPLVRVKLIPNVPPMDEYKTFEQWEAEAAFTIVNTLYGTMVDTRMHHEQNKLETNFMNLYVEQLEYTSWISVLGKWNDYKFEFFQNEMTAALVIMDDNSQPLWQASLSLMEQHTITVNEETVSWDDGGLNSFDTVELMRHLAARLDTAGFRYFFKIVNLVDENGLDDIREITAGSLVEAQQELERKLPGLRTSDWVVLNEDKRQFPSSMPVFL